MQLKRRPVDWLVGLLEAGAFLTAVFSIATAFDQLHRLLELFSHFRLQYLAGSILLFVVLATLGRRRMAALMFAVTVMNASYVLPWFWPSPEPGASSESIVLLHTNILASNTDTDRLLAHIDREAPDIVFVQELAHEHLPPLESLDAAYPYSIARPRDGSFGLGAWSKRPFLDAEVIPTPPRQYPSLRIVVDHDGGPVTIISTHPPPPIGAGFYDDRNTQLEAVAKLVDEASGSRIVIGDLNISPWATHYRRFEAAAGLDNVQRGHGIKPSWPVFLPIAMIPIDHALVSSDLFAADTRTLASVGSDHLPLLVRIARRRAPPVVDPVEP